MKASFSSAIVFHLVIQSFPSLVSVRRFQLSFIAMHGSHIFLRCYVVVRFDSNPISRR